MVNVKLSDEQDIDLAAIPKLWPWVMGMDVSMIWKRRHHRQLVHVGRRCPNCKSPTVLYYPRTLGCCRHFPGHPRRNTCTAPAQIAFVTPVRACRLQVTTLPMSRILASIQAPRENACLPMPLSSLYQSRCQFQCLPRGLMQFPVKELRVVLSPNRFRPSQSPEP